MSNKALGTPMTSDQYVEHWTKNSEAIKNAGGYAWMADRVAPAKLVLDIGIGTGRGILELAKRGARVIAVEVADKAIERTKKILGKRGISLQVCNVDEAAAALTGKADVVVIHGDAFDPKLAEVVQGLPVEAITCWLIGAAPEQVGKTTGVGLDQQTPELSPQYRKLVHRKCLELGIQVLSTGGAVHFVDRGFIRDLDRQLEAKTEAFAPYRALDTGNDYTMEIADVEVRVLASKAISASGIQHVGQLPTPDVTPVLYSILARRK
jgi:SAM-dependent methyltransferase